MSPDTLLSLRNLVFPPGRQSSNDLERWHQEAFTFSQEESTRFALVQNQGGPCGILASVQAFVIAKLQAMQIRNADGGGALCPSSEALQEAFDESLTDMLRRASMAPRTSSKEFTPTVVIVTATDTSNATLQAGSSASDMEIVSVPAADEGEVQSILSFHNYMIHCRASAPLYSLVSCSICVDIHRDSEIQRHTYT
jgi:hypothetical protein